MKTTKIVVETDTLSFRNVVNDHLSIGWKVVPNTISISMVRSPNPHSFNFLCICVVVLEKDDNEANNHL